ncbi:MAG: hypothetical protein RIS35_3791, partial [Pseudomonadota bacterium]
DYPHQFSGGMRQRVLIAIAVSCEPELLIADEPTTALDVTVQAQILRLLLRLRQELGMALMLISHDFGVIAGMVERVYVMVDGEIVEDAPVDDALTRPRHPYTSGLLRSLPRLARRKERLASIPGRVPTPAQMPAGCRFRERCPQAANGCDAAQVLSEIEPGRRVRCARAGELTLPGAVA